MANEPITREEMLLNAVATGEAANLEPITREEMFLAKLGGADVTTPTPVTRKEQFLQKVIEGGGSGGGDASTLTELIEGTAPVDLVNNQVTVVRGHAFSQFQNLMSVDLPAVTSIGTRAFYYCQNLMSVDFQATTIIGNDAFLACAALATANFPAATTIDGGAFGSTSLATADFPAVTSVGGTSFQSCRALTALILRNTAKVATLANVSALNNTPIKSGTGYIYVPRALVDGYKAATNWSAYAEQFRALEDYTVDGTVTGALDPNKI